MKILVGFLMSFFPVFAFAQSGVVVKSKNGKSVVNFNGQFVPPGAYVLVASGSGREPASVTSGNLTNRNHSLSYGLSYENYTRKGGGRTDTGTNSTIALSYFRNLTQWEAGADILLNQGDFDGTEIGFKGRWNFKENRPGIAIVPYAGGRFGLLSGDLQGTRITASGGLNWFPFAHLFAVDASLNYSILNYRANGVNYEGNSLGVEVGWRIMF